MILTAPWSLMRVPELFPAKLSCHTLVLALGAVQAECVFVVIPVEDLAAPVSFGIRPWLRLLTVHAVILLVSRSAERVWLFIPWILVPNIRVAPQHTFW